jgi:hypothetical protein
VKYAITVLGALVAIAIAAVPSLAGMKGAHFVGAPSITESGATLSAAVKVAGFGNVEQIHVTLSADAACINPGSQHPQGANKEVVQRRGRLSGAEREGRVLARPDRDVPAGLHPADDRRLVEHRHHGHGSRCLAHVLVITSWWGEGPPLPPLGATRGAGRCSGSGTLPAAVLGRRGRVPRSWSLRDVDCGGAGEDAGWCSLPGGERKAHR